MCKTGLEFFFPQKFNFDFPRKNVQLFLVKTRENAAVLDFLAIDNFDFTRKIVKKKVSVKTCEMVFLDKNLTFRIVCKIDRCLSNEVDL